MVMKVQSVMNAELYYFSGTGNSLVVARDLADKIDAELYSIPSVMGRERVVSDADALGVVFPVYHKGLPLIVKRFAKKLENVGDTYLFAVYTYGDTTGVVAEHLDRELRTHGGALAAAFGVQMPYNYLTPQPKLKGFFDAFTLREVPLDKQRDLIAAAPERIKEIAAAVQARTRGDFDVVVDPLTLLADRLNLSEALAKPIWLKVAGVEDPPDVSFIESRQWMDEAFRVEANCTACGICVRVCPVGNIRMVDDVPTWQHRCEQCFACLQWCPEAAIEFGRATAGKRRYHHPDVTLADMVRAASKDESV
jgi:ferredoxin/flavodoxin